MENNKPTRASQTKKSDSTKVQSQAKAVKPMARPKVWAPPTNSQTCLLYTSPSPRDGLLSRMPSSA